MTECIMLDCLIAWRPFLLVQYNVIKKILTSNFFKICYNINTNLICSIKLLFNITYPDCVNVTNLFKQINLAIITYKFAFAQCAFIRYIMIYNALYNLG